MGNPSRNMAVTFDLENKSAFVLRRDAVSRVWTILESAIGSVSATARCADDARREFGSLSQLLEFDNAKAKEICSLEFSARSQDFERRGDVTFEGRSRLTPIAVTLSAQEDGEILQVREELKDVIDGTRAWYSSISRVNVEIWFLAFVIILLLVAKIAVGDPPGPTPGVELGQAVMRAAQVLGILGAFGLFGWGLWRLHARYFPLAFFALGQGAERYRFDDNMRWVGIVGLVVSVFGSLVVSFVWGWASRGI